MPGTHRRPADGGGLVDIDEIVSVASIRLMHAAEGKSLTGKAASGSGMRAPAHRRALMATRPGPARSLSDRDVLRLRVILHRPGNTHVRTRPSPAARTRLAARSGGARRGRTRRVRRMELS